MKVNGRHLRVKLQVGVLVAALLIGVGLSGAPAIAQPAPAPGSGVVSVAAARPAQPAGEPTVASCPVTRFGYTIWATCSEIGVGGDWNRDGTYDEWWVVLTNRTIWHAWPGSNGWHEMPHGGRADSTVSTHLSAQGNRTIKVHVAAESPNGYYCTTDYAPPGGWLRWTGCTRWVP